MWRHVQEIKRQRRCEDRATAADKPEGETDKAAGEKRGAYGRDHDRPPASTAATRANRAASADRCCAAGGRAGPSNGAADRSGTVEAPIAAWSLASPQKIRFSVVISA